MGRVRKITSEDHGVMKNRRYMNVTCDVAMASFAKLVGSQQELGLAQCLQQTPEHHYPILVFKLMQPHDSFM